MWHYFFFELQHIIFFKKYCVVQAHGSQLTEICGHITISMLRGNTAYCGELLKLRGEDFSRYSNKIQSVASNKYHHLTRKVMSQTLSSLRQCPQATSVVHSKLDYCNSVYYNLPKSQIIRIQQIQNSLACAVVKAAKSCHINSYLTLSSLAQNNRTHRIQTPLTHLQSPHNHPNSTSA